MKKQPAIWLFVLMVFIIPLAVFGLYQWYGRHWQPLPVLKEGMQVRVKGLTTQHGTPFSEMDWSGKIVVADFFFTRCPTICPKMTAGMKQVQQAFAKDEPGIVLSSFSVDPERDSAQALVAYCRRMKIDDRNWFFLTGSKKEIYRLARNGFGIVATDGDGGPADFIHSEKLVLLDSRQRIRGYYDGTSESETQKLIDDIKKLRNEE
jgi:protein SCO1/2